jgi:arylsulfatase
MSQHRLRMVTTRRRRQAALVAIGLMLAAVAVAAPAPASQRPNFLVIVADDLGYSDLGSFGGEIETPNLDRLAREGLRFSAFHAAATCSPSRAMLLTGVDAHKAGLGNMAEDLAPNQEGHEEYLGYLNTHVATLAERLQDAGYATYMAGKWHLGGADSQSPAARGFERSFALMQGGASHYDMTGPSAGSPRARYRRDGRLIDRLPRGFYSTDYYASQMIEYLRSDRQRRPFFAYLAFTAPHWPLQAPEQLIRKYQARYATGPAALREQRLDGLLREGLLTEAVQAHPAVPPTPEWSSLSAEAQRREARKMAIYAAMIDSLDTNVGRVLAQLRKSGELDNTVIIFLSDNGAEAHDLSADPYFTDWVAKGDQRFDRLGRPGSFVYYGLQWGQAGTVPWRLYKGYPTEGGIRVPAFIWRKDPGTQGINRSLISVMDVTPTLLDLAGVEYSDTTFRGRTVHAIEGRSLRPVLEGRATSVRSDADFLGWELFGRSAIRSGNWKAVQLGQQDSNRRWELYDLATDPAEMRDLAAEQPARAKAMLEFWQRYATENRVILPDVVSAY